MKLKMNFKQTRATSAGNIDSPNLLDFQNVNAALYKHVSTFSSLYRNISIVLNEPYLVGWKCSSANGTLSVQIVECLHSILFCLRRTFLTQDWLFYYLDLD